MSEKKSGFESNDFDLLRRLGETADPDDALATDIDVLWAKAEYLIGALGTGLFGTGGFSFALWPDDEAGERGPFLWGRLKRAGQDGFATHIGLFLSPDFCNLAIDLEKDLVEAGESDETVAQVLAFYRSEAASLIDPPAHPEMRVWTDTRNVVPAAGYADIDFEAFMADNRDAGHPWPKVGYLLSADDVVRFGDGFVGECKARATALVPVYDAMIESFER
jgi:hypothetical protein